jgi:hypothetical protein
LAFLNCAAAGADATVKLIQMRAISERADKTWRMGILSINDVISVT